MENQYTQLYEKLAALQWLLHRHHLHNHAERGPFADPTRGQGRVLAALKLQPEISTKDMSYLLGIRQQSLNELVGKLEKAGYVVRTPSQTDRRVMMIRLTEEGKALEQDDHDFSGIFDCLSPEEQQAFGDYLDRVIAALEARVGADGEEEELRNWAHAARGRMGNELFERMMSRRGGFGPHGRDPHDRGFWGERDDFGRDCRGPAPFERGHGGHAAPPPPPPPKGPHDPDDE